MTRVTLAVNGGLMRGMRANQAMLDVGARFVRDATTAPRYRLWSVNDRFPAMIQASSGGAAIALELWTLTTEGFVEILNREPRGLSVGKVELSNGEHVLGVLGEPILCENNTEITSYGGWRAYQETLQK